MVAGLLTKKFISLIHEAKDGTLDLNKTADVLEVWFGSILKFLKEYELFWWSGFNMARWSYFSLVTFVSSIVMTIQF